MLCALLCLTCFCAVSGCGESEPAPTLNGTWTIQSYRLEVLSYSSQYRKNQYKYKDALGAEKTPAFKSDFTVNDKTVSFSHDGESEDTFTADSLTVKKENNAKSKSNNLWYCRFLKKIGDKNYSVSLFSMTDSYLYCTVGLKDIIGYAPNWSPDLLVKKGADLAPLISKIATVKTETEQDGDETKNVYEVSNVDISSLCGKTFKNAAPVGPSDDKREYTFKIDKEENGDYVVYLFGEKYEVENVGASAYYSPAVQISTQYATESGYNKNIKNNFTIFEITDDYILFSYTTYPFETDRNQNLSEPDAYREFLRLDLVK